MDDLGGDATEIPGADPRSPVGRQHHQIYVVLGDVLDDLFRRVPHDDVASGADAFGGRFAPVSRSDLLSSGTHGLRHVLHVGLAHGELFGLVRIAYVQQFEVYVQPPG